MMTADESVMIADNIARDSLGEVLFSQIASDATALLSNTFFSSYIR